MSLEERIQYTFKNPQYLRRALTHSSYSNESREKPESNERMEFLGTPLSLAVSDYIFHRYHLDEGDLTRIRAGIVCEKSLFRFAQEIKLGEELLLGKGEEQMGGRNRLPSSPMPLRLLSAPFTWTAALSLPGSLFSALPQRSWSGAPATPL